MNSTRSITCPAANKAYTADQTLRIAKRFHNTKRTYLLVNPLQAKHMPVSPSASLEMMRALGGMLKEKYGGAGLVIGFAETATAIGAVVAETIGNCIYIHTTREPMPETGDWVLFREEHSHAVEQKLAAADMEKWIDSADTVLFVEDEISTGKTLRNIISQMKMRFPALAKKTIVAASVLNRVGSDDRRLMDEAGVITECLVKLPEEDYAARVAEITIHGAEPAVPGKISLQVQHLDCPAMPNPRTGVPIGDYSHSCGEIARVLLENCAIADGSTVLVLGTEECMYPMLRTGEMLENSGRNIRVRCHATTRSPIGVCGDTGYPIASGSKIHSFYEDGRDTFIYNLQPCDAAIIISDAPVFCPEALEDLIGAMPEAPEKIYFLHNDILYKKETL